MPLTNVDPNITSQMTANLISAFIPTMNNSVNLTGGITATLVQPSVLYTTGITAAAIVISGIMGSFLALYGVKKTLEYSDEREERNRMEEARKLSREERKNAYVRFTAYMNKLYLVNNISTQDLATPELEELVNQHAQYWSEISLINPQIATEIGTILISMSGVTPETVTDVVNKAYVQYNTKILPLMQADLASPSSPEEASTKHWWQIWK